MTDNKHISGLRLVNATRLELTNHDADVSTITVNGRKLSHADVDLGTLLISGESVKTKDAVDGQYYEVLNTNSQIEVKLEEEVQAGKVQSGQIIPAGDQLFKQQSPAPFAYIDTTGRLGSANLWNQLFVANVMGYVDIDKGKHILSRFGSAGVIQSCGVVFAQGWSVGATEFVHWICQRNFSVSARYPRHLHREHWQIFACELCRRGVGCI